MATSTTSGKRPSVWAKKSEYPPFMRRGGIYGRTRIYPFRAWRTRYLFRTCIHIRFADHDFTRASENARAYNRALMVPHFAYQMRPRRPTPPGPRKTDALRQDIPWELMQCRKAA